MGNENQPEEILEHNEQESSEAEGVATTTNNNPEDELAKVMAERDDYREALQRERADFQNFRKRAGREKDELTAKAASRTLTRFLPIADDFERALEAIPAEERDNEWLQGINLIHRKLQSLLDAEGIRSINPLGEPFDPNFHEAIGTDEPSEEFESGHVTAVLQKGYMRGAEVLRPAMVRVAS